MKASASSRKKAVYKRMGSALLDERVHNILAGKQIQPRFDRLGRLKGLYVAVASRPVRLYDVIDPSFQNMLVIHMNKDQWDFRRSNLKVATSEECAILNNTLTDHGNAGLVRQTKTGLYTAAITLNKVQVYLGTYQNKEMASEVYQHQVLVRERLFSLPDFDIEKYRAIKTVQQGRAWLGFSLRKVK
jgi:hypothetical protein